MTVIRKKYDRIGKGIWFRTKKGKKHPFVKQFLQIRRGFEIAEKLNKDKEE
jgi:hypothetical protein